MKKEIGQRLYEYVMSQMGWRDRPLWASATPECKAEWAQREREISATVVQDMAERTIKGVKKLAGLPL